MRIGSSVIRVTFLSWLLWYFMLYTYIYISYTAEWYARRIVRLYRNHFRLLRGPLESLSLSARIHIAPTYIYMTYTCVYYTALSWRYIYASSVSYYRRGEHKVSAAPPLPLPRCSWYSRALTVGLYITHARRCYYLYLCSACAIIIMILHLGCDVYIMYMM